MEDNLNLFVNDKEVLKGRLSELDLSLAQLSPSLVQTFVMIVVWTKKISFTNRECIDYFQDMSNLFRQCAACHYIQQWCQSVSPDYKKVNATSTDTK